MLSEEECRVEAQQVWYFLDHFEDFDAWKGSVLSLAEQFEVLHHLDGSAKLPSLSDDSAARTWETNERIAKNLMIPRVSPRMLKFDYGFIGLTPMSRSTTPASFILRAITFNVKELEAEYHEAIQSILALRRDSWDFRNDDDYVRTVNAHWEAAKQYKPSADDSIIKTAVYAQLMKWGRFDSKTECLDYCKDLLDSVRAMKPDNEQNVAHPQPPIPAWDQQEGELPQWGDVGCELGTKAAEGQGAHLPAADSSGPEHVVGCMPGRWASPSIVTNSAHSASLLGGSEGTPSRPVSPLGRNRSQKLPDDADNQQNYSDECDEYSEEPCGWGWCFEEGCKYHRRRTQPTSSSGGRNIMDDWDEVAYTPASSDDDFVSPQYDW